MRITEALLTNTAYGYPRGDERDRKPYVIAVLHQTANAMADACQERDYANRAGSMGPSATYYVNADGSCVHAVDGTRYAAWGSGDLDHPNIAISTVSRIATEQRTKDVNANTAVWEQIEVCGAGPEPYGSAQFESVAQLVATRAKLSGLPIDRSTVLVHADLNSVDRASDPWPASTREARVARVIDRARQLAGVDMIYTLGGIRTGEVAAGTPWYDEPGAATPHAKIGTTTRYLLTAFDRTGTWVALDGLYDAPTGSKPAQCGWVLLTAVSSIQPVVGPIPITVSIPGHASQTVTF